MRQKLQFVVGVFLLIGMAAGIARADSRAQIAGALRLAGEHMDLGEHREAIQLLGKALPMLKQAAAGQLPPQQNPS